MSVLLIKTNNPSLRTLPWCWFLYIFCTFFYFLGNGYSQSAALACVLILIFLIAFNWAALKGSKREVLIEKEGSKVTVFETKFFGKRVFKVFLIKDFTGIRSYVYNWEGTSINYVELVNIDGTNKLILSAFSASSNGKFFSRCEHENKEATNLRSSVSKFTGLTDLGFLGVSNNWV